MENKEEMKRPIILEMDETKLELIQVINTAMQLRGIPCYFLDMILAEICAQVKEGAKNELEIARAQVKKPESNEEVV